MCCCDAIKRCLRGTPSQSHNAWTDHQDATSGSLQGHQVNATQPTHTGIEIDASAPADTRSVTHDVASATLNSVSAAGGTQSPVWVSPIIPGRVLGQDIPALASAMRADIAAMTDSTPGAALSKLGVLEAGMREALTNIVPGTLAQNTEQRS